MSEKLIALEIQHDLVERLSKSPPVQALAELIWNGLDAEASKVDVSWDNDPLGGVERISVRDNGDGIPYKDAPDLFKRLGGSWKKIGGKTRSGLRWLHGHEGKGRYKAFSFGRVVEWRVVYEKTTGKNFTYTITLIADNLKNIRLSDEIEISGAQTGVEVSISEIKTFAFLEKEETKQELEEVFAIYLLSYPNVVLSYQSIRLDPNTAIETQKKIQLADIVIDTKKVPVWLDIIEWKNRLTADRLMYLCNEHGFALNRFPVQYQTLGYKFSSYLCSEYISNLHENGLLDVPEMDQSLTAILEQAKLHVKDYFRDRAARDASDIVEVWKQEESYPYKEPAKNEWEDAERKVFDIVAVKVSQAMPDLAITTKKVRGFHLRMLRQAIERCPEDLQFIFENILNLPERERKDFAELLERASLQAIIGASKMVADRLRFLSDLETMLFDKNISKHVLERSQLHRILADNTWIFGEHFSLSVDDQSLTEVLKAHHKILGNDIKIDEPVLIDGQKRGVIDLMLSQLIKTNVPEEMHHLVVELKRPRKKIDSAEIVQIEKYANSVASDPRFTNVNVRWDFWIIGTELADYAKTRSRGKDMPHGLIHRDTNKPISIWCKSWGEIIQENKSRLTFIQEKLNYRVDRGGNLEYVRQRYQDILKNVPADPESESKAA